MSREFSSTDLLLFIQIPFRFVHTILHGYSWPPEAVLKRTDKRALVAVCEYGPAPMKILGMRIGMAKGSFTQVIDKLVGMELVVRSESPGDRRIVLVSATKKGLEMKRKLDCKLADYLKDRLGAISDQEKDTLLEALKTIEKISEKLEKHYYADKKR